MGRWVIKKSGYIIKNKNTIYIDPKAKIGENVIIYENSRIEGISEIGDNVTIYSGSYIVNSIIGKGSKIYTSVIENSKIGSCCYTSAYSCIKCGSKISSFVKVGNGAVIKNSVIGEYSEIGTNSSVSGSKISRHCKIGAGAVLLGSTDKATHDIELETGVLIGANACIIAPIKIDSGKEVLAGNVLSPNSDKD